MEEKNKFVRFDWAAKRMLRDKANFGVLEGLVTVLLNEEVHIQEILESESNQDSDRDKYNRVDIKALNSKGEIILVEIQLTREMYFMERLLFGVSKSIIEHIGLGDNYDHIKKIYSIGILYFDLGKGTDYLYHGTTSFVGVHTHDTLQITSQERGALGLISPGKIFPEYYLIRVNEFNKVAATPLEEWIDYLKDGHIKEDTTAPGLQEARAKLLYMKMSKSERASYEEHIDAILSQNNSLEASRQDGLAEGRAAGLAEGRAAERAEIARTMLEQGLPVETISKCTGLTAGQISSLIGNDAGTAP